MGAMLPALDSAYDSAFIGWQTSLRQPSKHRIRTAAGLAGLLLAALCMLGFASCHRDHPQTVRVFAAASLTASFEALAQAFETNNPGIAVELHCAGTPRLVLQLREGASVDVFASANEAQMQRVVDAGQTAAAPVVFATNSLCIITQKGNPKGITQLSDLQRQDLSVLLCGPEVPAGRYAREILAQAAVAVQSLSDEPSVRAVTSKVRLGVVDAGIVYAADAQTAGQPDPDLHAVAIPAASNISARYPIATLSVGKQQQLGAAFTAFVCSPAGQRILAAHGFATP